MNARSPFVWLLLAALAAPFFPGDAGAQDFDQTSCDEFLLAPRQARGQAVGPASCMMQETDVTVEGRTFRRLDMGIDGAVEGFATRSPVYGTVLTNSPDLVFPQVAGAGTPAFGIAKYRRSLGASMTVLYPLDRSQWNGKLWVTVHGEGLSFANGSLRAWENNLDRTRPLHDLDANERLVLSKGYALAKTRRTSAPAMAPGPVPSAEDDDDTAVDVALTDASLYIADFTMLATSAVKSRMGVAPSRTYLYGHSAGASLGRAINYTPGLNAGPGGRPVFDAIMADSAAGGAWLPLTVKSGARLVPQMDIVRQLYAAPWRAGSEAVSPSPLVNARAGASTLATLGYGDAVRIYEVRGATHQPGPTAAADANPALDLAPLMDRLIELLDAWADRGVAPPPNRSDAAAVATQPAIALPGAACPLGVHHPSPHSGSSGGGFAPFGSDDELEPLDSREVFVDMNRNGIRDRRETATQAWRRLGLLRAGEELTHDRYVACVDSAARALQQTGFLSDRSAAAYVERARTVALPRGSQAP